MGLVIVGAGGHGHDLAAIATAMGLSCRLVDDDPEHLYAVPATPQMYALGVNDPATRKAMDARFEGWSPKSLIHPHAHVGPHVKWSHGVVVAAGAVLQNNVWLGRHAHVNYGASMCRTVIGDYCTIAPGVTICGDVNIGDGAFVGAGATIKNLVTIGAGAVIGCGAVVVEDVPAGATVKGNPAR